MVSRWQLCEVRRMLSSEDGSLIVEITITVESSESRTGYKEVPYRVPIIEAEKRADAVAPGALQGAQVYKKFEDGLWYVGKVGKFDKREGWYKITYEDGDTEDMNTKEVLESLYKTMPHWDFCDAWQESTKGRPAAPLRTGTARGGRTVSEAVDTAGVEKKGKLYGRQKRQKVTEEEEELSESYVSDDTVTSSSSSSEEEESEQEEEEEEEAIEVESPRRRPAHDHVSRAQLTSNHPSRVISPPKLRHNIPLAAAAAAALGDGGAAGAGPSRDARRHSPPVAPLTAPAEQEAGIEAFSLPEDMLTTAAAAAATAPAAARATRAPQPQQQQQRPPARPVLVTAPTSGFYAVSGAGHQRGALAYDRHTKTFRPIGKWVTDLKAGTLLGRFSIDRRFLDVDEPQASSGRSEAVPGWIGVRGTFQNYDENEEEEENGDGDGSNKVVSKKKKSSTKSAVLGAPYTIVYYEPNQAKQCHLLYPTFDTAEEAAATYDQFALSFYDPAEVDLNYAMDPEAREEAATTWKNEYSKLTGRKPAILCAVAILNFERSIPDGAVKVGEGAATLEDWEKFE